MFLGSNWYDVAFLGFILYFVFTSTNFLFGVFELISFLATIVLSYKYYPLVSAYLVSVFSLPRGISQASGFFLVWFIIETVLFIAVRLIIARIPPKYYNHPLNHALASIPAVVQAAIFFLLITVTVFSLPTQPFLKQTIMESRSGPYFISFSHVFENKVKGVFGEAVNETLNFITVREGGDSQIDLGFKAPSDKLSNDPQSEEEMTTLINKERVNMGLPSLNENSLLRTVARTYATEMFESGFFSHESAVDGSTPAERADRNGVEYRVIGENLAYAPDVYIAHQGLMNSPGHRANILSPDFHKVGIGVIDGGIYGRIFVQEFTN